MKNFISKLQDKINQALVDIDNLKILEAGCGSLSQIVLNKRAYITGIDISQKQLDRNLKLDCKILGDIQFYKFKQHFFDLIVCWDVLEHLEYPEFALKNFKESLRDNGLIVLKLPNIFSIKGLLTKYTPQTFHILVYKNIYRSKRMLKEESGPFKTFLKYSIAPGALKNYASKSGLKCIYFDTIDISENNLMIKNKIILKIYKTLKTILCFLSFKKLGDSEFVMVLQK